MPIFDYTAEVRPGETVEGSIASADLPTLGRKLALDGLRLKSARAPRPASGPGRIPALELVAAYRQLAASTTAGMPLADTLRLMSLECRSDRLRRLLSSLHQRVAGGDSLADALSEFPRVFPGIYLELVRAGEAGGVLDQTLVQIADHAEQATALNRKIASALVYPAVVGSVAIFVLFSILTVIVPKFLQLYVDLGFQELPLVTRIISVAADFARTGLLILLVLAVFVYVLSLRVRASQGNLAFDRFKLRLPVVGELIEKRSAARMLSTLSILLSTGAPLVEAMKLAAGSSGNRVAKSAMDSAAAVVASGESFGRAVEQENVLPPTAAWQIGVAEENGTLPETLSRTAEFYQAQAESLASDIAGLVEPVLIIVLGACVGLVVVSLFYPLAEIVGGLISPMEY